MLLVSGIASHEAAEGRQRPHRTVDPAHTGGATQLCCAVLQTEHYRTRCFQDGALNQTRDARNEELMNELQAD